MNYYTKSVEQIVLGADPESQVAYYRQRVEFLENQLAWLEAERHVLHNRTRDALSDADTDYICTVRRCLGQRDERSNFGLCEAHIAEAAHDHIKTLAPQVESESARTERQARESVVYYVQLGDRIKIGTTTNLANRLRSFYALPDQLLAIEPGGLVRERERHQQFAAQRFPRTELFAPSDELHDIIRQARDMFGDPANFL